MRKVVSKTEVAHLFTNQLQEEARTATSNLFFRGKSIYSYGHHFCIAKFVTNSEGSEALLFTERSYSNTTAKHISIVRNATRHKNVIYCYNPENTKEDNFNQWLREVEAVAAKLVTARKPEKYLNEIDTIKARVEKYATFFAVPIPETLAAALSIGDKEAFKEYAANKAALKAKEEKAKAAAAAKAHKEQLKKWLNFETSYLHTRASEGDYLRLNGDTVETTQGVKIPLETAKGLYVALKQNTVNVGDKFMSYVVNKVGKEIGIGCHTFKRDYLLSFGAKL